jgi:hypothetical protein
VKPALRSWPLVRRKVDVIDQRRCFIGLDSAACFIAIDDRHLDVHQDEIGPVLGRRGNAFLAVGRLDHLEAGSGEQVAENASIVSVSSITRMRLLMRRPPSIAIGRSRPCRTDRNHAVGFDVE